MVFHLSRITFNGQNLFYENKMRKTILLFITLFNITPHAFAIYSEGDINLPLQSSVVNYSDCFSGFYSSYESWKNSTVINSGVKEQYFIHRFSEDDYHLFKENTFCYSITYKVNKHLVKGFLLYPKENNYKKIPSIIYNRGGNDSKYHTLTFDNLFSYLFPLALEGHIVIASQYGGAKVWPKSFKGNGGVDEFGGAEVNDVLALIPIIDALPIADPNRIAMFGWSRGGMMSLIAVTKTDRIKTLILGASPVDYITSTLTSSPFENEVLSRLIPNYKANKAQALKQRSAIYWADKIPKDIAILMLHGTNDKRVDVNSVINFVDLIKRLGINVKLKKYENGSHSLIESRGNVYNSILDWLKNNL
ncbi:Dipeptidyl aminopeptidases/acylaminoacyl-peptidase [Shewanella piezotolerans WP3]|uniref:Dipeptidyl aminopeptidases/acylaminoacyl-peptidase n=2 Tax=Shewanella TaxID=22 RepID=B8CH03_SHEPW|nr:Dipeptidyl aminopeptidases/acylaminoacyl-peptidase [Shewanella piezotolerans WP3]